MMMNWLRLLALVTIISLALAGPLTPAYCENSGSLPDATLLTGMYGNDTERFLIRERAGQLELLYDTDTKAEATFAVFVSFPLSEVAPSRYSLLSYSPLRRETAAVWFDKDRAGRGVVANIGAKKYQRRFFDVEEGRTFQIKALLPADELRQKALLAQPPVEQGTFLSPDLVELAALDPTIKLDIRYAGTNNFMGIQLYDEPRAFLQRPAAEAVVRIQNLIKKYGYGLIVYDAYRPWYVTKMFWDATPDSQKVFVADPAKGSRHNRGSAVDVGLYDLQTGAPVDMGSDYDEFSIRAYPAYPGGTTQQRGRRDLLRTMMESEGFSVYPEEWWHFDFQDWKKYPILNLRFNKI